MPWPLTPREFLFCSSIRYDAKEKRYVTLRKTIEQHPHVQFKKEYVRADCFGGNVIQEVSPNSCVRYEMQILHIGGIVPKTFIQESLKQRCKNENEELVKILKEKAKVERPDDGILHTLDDNSKPNVQERVETIKYRNPNDILLL